MSANTLNKKAIFYLPLSLSVFSRLFSLIRYAAVALSLCVVGVAYGQTDSPAVSGDGQTMVVGQSDEEQVLVYVRDEENKQWSQQATLEADDTQSGDLFGSRVAINYDGDLVAVGAPGRNSSAGAVYIFIRNADDTWTQSTILEAGNVGEGDQFGSSVALDDAGVLLAAGAPGEASSVSSTDEWDDNGAPGAGAVYTFALDAGGTGEWTATNYLKAISLNNSRRDDFIGAGDRFGYSVALSGDGRVLAVGAPFDDSNPPGSAGVYEGATVRNNAPSGTDSGMVMVFERYGTHEAPGQVSTSNDEWTLDYFFKATNVGGGDLFGTSVALDNRGYILAVGAPGEDNDGSGVEYSTQSVELTPAYGSLHDGDDENAVDSGAVYIYHYQRDFDLFTDSEAVIGGGDAGVVSPTPGLIWQSAGYIKSPNSEAGDEFGSSVALSGAGNVLAVGAIGEDADLSGIYVDTAQSNEEGDGVGAVYLYRGYGDSHWVRTDGCYGAALVLVCSSGETVAYRTLSWELSAYVKPSESGLTAYGSAAALSDGGGTLTVGSEGGFDRISDIDELVGIPKDVETVSRVVNDTLTAPDSYELGQGSKVAISADGQVMAVGDRWVNSTAGAVYIYEKDAMGEWALIQTLSASNAGAGDTFGASVAISDDSRLILIGAPGEDGSGTGIADSEGLSADDAATDAGALYVFELNSVGNQWEEVWYVKASDAEADDRFGHSIAISNDGGTFVVGAPGESTAAGAAYVFDTTESSTQWIEEEKLVGEGAGDQFGYSVAVSGDGDTVSVGAPYDDGCAYNRKAGSTGCTGSGDSGAVYVWGRQTQQTLLGVWDELAYVKGDGTAQAGRRFGHSVSMSDDGQVLAVGAPYSDAGTQEEPIEEFGEVSVFQWIRVPYHPDFQPYFPVEKLATELGLTTLLRQNMYFGSSVALSDDGLLLAIGAVGETSTATGINPAEQGGSGSTEVGVVQIWQYGADKEWELLSTVKPQVADPEGRFGDSAAFSRSGEGLSLAIGGVEVAAVVSGPALLEKRTEALEAAEEEEIIPLSIEAEGNVSVTVGETIELSVTIDSGAGTGEVMLMATILEGDERVSVEVVSTRLVTLTGVSAGTARVELEASGEGYLAATAEVSVEVREEEEEIIPLSIEAERSVSVTVGETIELSVTIDSGAGTEEVMLKATILEGDERVSVEVVSAGLVRLTGVSAGTARVELEASGDGYSEATAEVMVTVNALPESPLQIIGDFNNVAATHIPQSRTLAHLTMVALGEGVGCSPRGECELRVRAMSAYSDETFYDVDAERDDEDNVIGISLPIGHSLVEWAVTDANDVEHTTTQRFYVAPVMVLSGIDDKTVYIGDRESSTVEVKFNYEIRSAYPSLSTVKGISYYRQFEKQFEEQVLEATACNIGTSTVLCSVEFSSTGATIVNYTAEVGSTLTIDVNADNSPDNMIFGQRSFAVANDLTIRVSEESPPVASTTDSTMEPTTVLMIPDVEYYTIELVRNPDADRDDINGTPDEYAEEGIYDFIVDIPEGTDRAYVAYALLKPLEEDKPYAKYEYDSNSWESFVTDDSNAVYSALGIIEANGNVSCPAPFPPDANSPDDVAWLPWSDAVDVDGVETLQARHQCVLLVIEDGGPNDINTDGQNARNGVVYHLGAVGYPFILPDAPEQRRGKGSTDLWMLLLLLTVLVSSAAIRRLTTDKHR